MRHCDYSFQSRIHGFQVSSFVADPARGFHLPRCGPFNSHFIVAHFILSCCVCRVVAVISCSGLVKGFVDDSCLVKQTLRAIVNLSSGHVENQIRLSEAAEGGCMGR